MIAAQGALGVWKEVVVMDKMQDFEVENLQKPKTCLPLDILSYIGFSAAELTELILFLAAFDGKKILSKAELNFKKISPQISADIQGTCIPVESL